jgi:hypothetical protein
LSPAIDWRIVRNPGYSRSRGPLRRRPGRGRLVAQQNSSTNVEEHRLYFSHYSPASIQIGTLGPELGRSLHRRSGLPANMQSRGHITFRSANLSLASVVLVPLSLFAILSRNYADVAAAFDKDSFNLREIVDTMLSHHAEQLFRSHKLFSHVCAIHPCMLEQGDWWRIGKSLNYLGTQAKPIHQEVPEYDGQNENEAIQHRVVFTGHCVLSRICDKNDHQQIGNADSTRLASQHSHQYQDE